MNYCNQYISSQVAESPAADLLLAVSPEGVAYLLVPPPQSLAQIAALHPNIWLSYPAKMASRYMGFMQLDYPIAGYRAM